MRTNARRLVVVSVSIAASAALLAALVTPASAQQSIERVEITGSALKRIDAETALPVQIITREEIDTVLNRLEDTLRELRGTVLQPGLTDEWDATGTTPVPALSQDNDDSSSAVA